jgi:response regulator NasT
MFERLLVIGSYPSVPLEKVIEKLMQTSIVAEVSTFQDFPMNITSVDGVIINKHFNLSKWKDYFYHLKKTPLYWLYEHSCESTGGAEGPLPFQIEVDGILHEEMDATMLAWSLKRGKVQFDKWKKLELENNKLRNRLEERKVIDQAKEIVADNHGISLTKAYELLRTQAMRERRNMFEISRSLVTAQEILKRQRGLS